MLKKDDGDTGGGDSGRDGGVMALYLDAPPAAAPMSVKLVLANENAPGLPFAGASMLPDDEVVIDQSETGIEFVRAPDQTGRAAVVVASCVYVSAGTRWREAIGAERGKQEEVEGTRAPLDCLDGAARELYSAWKL